MKVLAGVIDWTQPMPVRFEAAMNDDFNTPEAFAVLFDLANELNRTHSPETAIQLKELANVLGVLQREPEEFLQGGQPSADGYSSEQIEQMIAQRLEARRSKNFAEADRIRKELLDSGVVLEDGPQGTIWRRA